MSPLVSLFLAVMVASPVAWLMSEFRGSRFLRVSLGLLALAALTSGVWVVNSVLTTFNYNAWYGSATGDLIRTSLRQMEDGRSDRVLTVWRGLDRQYQPGYESRARYRELVEEATRSMRSEQPIEHGSAWDVPLFTSETWVGHWESNDGYWLVVNDLDRPFAILRSGDPPTKMQSVSVSQDFTVLKFAEGARWSHTLTLRNKYEATHEWFDVTENKVWKTDTMHKLIRASDQQKQTTQRIPPTSVSQPVRSEAN